MAGDLHELDLGQRGQTAAHAGDQLLVGLRLPALRQHADRVGGVGVDADGARARVVAIDGGKRRELGEYLGVGTNNIAELTAIDRALDLAGADLGKRPVRIYTDSAYSIGVLSKNWKAKANQELIARMRRRLAGLHNIEFVKVSGHAGVPENERCDELARDAIARR